MGKYIYIYSKKKLSALSVFPFQKEVVWNYTSTIGYWITNTKVCNTYRLISHTTAGLQCNYRKVSRNRIIKYNLTVWGSIPITIQAWNEKFVYCPITQWLPILIWGGWRGAGNSSYYLIGPEMNWKIVQACGRGQNIMPYRGRVGAPYSTQCAV